MLERQTVQPLSLNLFRETSNRVLILNANTGYDNVEQWSHIGEDIPNRNIPIGNYGAEDKSWKSGMLPEKKGPGKLDDGRWQMGG